MQKKRNNWFLNPPLGHPYERFTGPFFFVISFIQIIWLPSILLNDIYAPFPFYLVIATLISNLIIFLMNIHFYWHKHSTKSGGK